MGGRLLFIYALLGWTRGSTGSRGIAFGCSRRLLSGFVLLDSGAGALGGGGAGGG